MLVANANSSKGQRISEALTFPGSSVDDLRRIVAGRRYKHEATTIMVVAHEASHNDSD
jgi:hypothetical protein